MSEHSAENDAGVRVHVLKVARPYMDALLDGSKTFEVRKNDRAFQQGDELILWEIPNERRHSPGFCEKWDCSHCKHRSIRKRVTFVYSGDPRFGGLEPFHVVLALGDTTVTPPAKTDPGGTP